MSIQQRLSSSLRRRNMTAYALAKETGLSQSILSYLLNGHKPIDKIEVGTAKRIATSLGVTLDYLCGMHDEKV